MTRQAAALAVTLALPLAGGALAGQSTYVSKDASRCEIFRALSAQIPDDCKAELEDKSPVIRPPMAGTTPSPAQAPVATPPPARVQAEARPKPPADNQRPPAKPAPRPTAGPNPRPNRERLPPPREIPTGQRAMATPIEFAFDSERLTPAAQRQIDNIAAVLKDPLFRGLVVRIEGHTDATGPDAYNLDLSRRRAQSVQEYLTGHHAIDRTRLPAEGKGESDPFDARRPEAGINRRVEFVNTGLAL